MAWDTHLHDRDADHNPDHGSAGLEPGPACSPQAAVGLDAGEAQDNRPLGHCSPAASAAAESRLPRASVGAVAAAVVLGRRQE